MKRNNIIALTGIVLVLASTDLNAGFFSRARETLFGPQTTPVEQHRRQLERDVEVQGPKALRQSARAPHGSQEYYTPSPAPTSYATQPLTPSQQAAQRGPAPLPPSAPTHAHQTPRYTTQQHYQGQGTPSLYAPQTPQASQPQQKQSFFGRVAHKVTNIVKPKTEEVVISGPSGYQKRSAKDAFPGSQYKIYEAYKSLGDEAIQAKQARANEETEAAARARAIPPKPTYSPPPRPQQPAAFSNNIPSEPRLSQKFPQTPPPIAPKPLYNPESSDISGPTNVRPYQPKTAEEIERARVAKAVQEAYDVANRPINIQPITYEPQHGAPVRPESPQRPARYINVPATRTDGQSADAPSLPLR